MRSLSTFNPVEDLNAREHIVAVRIEFGKVGEPLILASHGAAASCRRCGRRRRWCFRRVAASAQRLLPPAARLKGALAARARVALDAAVAEVVRDAWRHACLRRIEKTRNMEGFR